MTSSNETELLINYFKELENLLEKERTSLTTHDNVALSVVTEQKRLVCESIGSALKANPALTDLIRSADTNDYSGDNCAELDVDHKILLDLARSARDSNLVNGKILHRSQQSLREILGILSGKSFDGLYGQSGQQTAASGSSAYAIARA